MGGLIAFAIKKKNRILTRVVPTFLVSGLASVEFFKGQGDVWKQWNVAPLIEFAPIDYGLTIVDFDNHWVGSLQNYDNFNTFYSTYHSDTGFIRESQKKKLKQLWDDGRVSNIEGTDVEKKKMKKLLALSFEEALPDFEKMLNNRSSTYALLIKLKPPAHWVFNWFEKEDVEPFWALLKQKEFKLTNEDLFFWEKFLNENGFPNIARSEREQRELHRETPDLPSSIIIRPRL